MAKYHWIPQQSGEDCAAASLAIVAKHYGRRVEIERVRRAVATESSGASFASLRRGAETLGFLAKCVEAAPDLLDRLDEIPLPALIYWKGYHVVVLYGKRRETYVISDPGIGIRYITRQELLDGWQGRITIVLQPHPVRFWLQQSDSPNPFADVLGWLRLFRFDVGRAVLASLFVSAVTLALPLSAQLFIDRVLVPGGRQYGTLTVAAVFLLLSFSAGLTWVRSSAVAGFSQRMTTKLKKDFALRLLDIPLSVLESRSSGLVRNRLADLHRISSVLAGMIAEIPLHFSTIVGGVALLAAYNMSMALAATIAAVTVVLGTRMLYPIIKQAGLALSSRTAESFFALAELFSNALAIRTIGARSALASELERKFDAEATSCTRIVRIGALGTLAAQLFAAAGFAGVFWFALSVGFDGVLSTGQVIAVAAITMMVFSASSGLSILAWDWAETRAATSLLESLFEPPLVNAGGTENMKVAIAPADDIVCDGISFGYAGRAPLFNDLCLQIPGGRVSAIIGHSGCGKTTLAYILAGLHKPNAGRIEVGGREVALLPQAKGASQIVLVPQDARFFTRSITDNLRLAVPEATQIQIAAACRLSAAHEFINAFPQGYETIIGDFSANLSAGEKQRLAIARALLIDPPVLILDEATSNLDPPTEATVLTNVLQARSGKTTILISHRPRVVDRAGWIIWIDNGRIGSVGTAADFRRESSACVDFLNP